MTRLSSSKSKSPKMPSFPTKRRRPKPATKRTIRKIKQHQRMGQQQEQQKWRRSGRRRGQAACHARRFISNWNSPPARSRASTALDAPLKKPMWASVSPDGKTIVFARGYNLYMMDADNYRKAQKNPGDKSIVETQLTTDGVEKYSYARVLLDEEQRGAQEISEGRHKSSRSAHPGHRNSLVEGFEEICFRPRRRTQSR